MTIRIKPVLIALALVHMAPAVANQTVDRVAQAETLSDCAALFGLLAKAKTEQAEFARIVSVASTAYAQVAFADDKRFTQATGQSMQKAAAFVSELQTSDDQGRFEQEFRSCMATLETAEKTLRGEMPELTQAIVPELFK